MPVIHANYMSQALMHEVSFYAIIPALNTPPGPGQFMSTEILPPHTKFQTLYLLHGIFGNERSWLSGSFIEQYATERNIAVIMPSADLSFYADMYIGKGMGYNYGKFVGDELVKVSRLMFPLSDKREDTFIAGLSMGGYGATRVGLEYCDTFSAIGTLSGVVDAVTQFRDGDAAKQAGAVNPLGEVFYSCFGTPAEMENSVNDLFYMAKKRLDEGKLPYIYQACGSEDFLIAANRKFRDYLKNDLKLNDTQFKYEEEPGVHDWKFWDKFIQPCMDSFPLKRKAIV